MEGKPSAAQHAVAAPQPGPIPAAFEDNLGWLLAQCFRAHVSAMEGAIADFPHGQRGFQLVLGAAKCSADNQAGLARQLGLDRTVMVYLVDDLAKAGLVERVPDPHDRRSRLIRATEAGLARLASAQASISAAEAELLAVLDEDRQKALLETLRDLAGRHFASTDVAAACRLAEHVNEIAD